MLDRTVAYAGQRIAFGKPIGGFQAVQHRLADHAVRARGMALLVAEAAALARPPDPTTPIPLRGDGVGERQRGTPVRILHDLLQLTGGIGFTWEYGLRTSTSAGPPGRPPGSAARVGRGPVARRDRGVGAMTVDIGSPPPGGRGPSSPSTASPMRREGVRVPGRRGRGERRSGRGWPRSTTRGTSVAGGRSSGAAVPTTSRCTTCPDAGAVSAAGPTGRSTR